MKSLFIITTILSLSAFAQTKTPQDCLKQADRIDRKYCIEKYIDAISKAQAAEKKTWEAGLPQADKDKKIEQFKADVANKKDLIDILNQELALSQKHVADLESVKVLQPQAAPKKKKKKGFRIKL